MVGRVVGLRVPQHAGDPRVHSSSTCCWSTRATAEQEKLSPESDPITGTIRQIAAEGVKPRDAAKQSPAAGPGGKELRTDTPTGNGDPPAATA